MRHSPKPIGTICAVLLTLGFLLLTGCSTFERDWKKSAHHEPGGDFVGAWDGTWLSEHNGHHGRLRCLVERIGENRYEARFKASFLKVLTYTQQVELQAQAETQGTRFHGTKNLGWWAGGVYTYDGLADQHQFRCTYRCPVDHGVFDLHRPAGKQP